MKSVAQMKVEGTYRKDRHGKRDETEQFFAGITKFKDGDIVEPPVSIKDEYVKKSYVCHTRLLIKLHLLQETDIPQINLMYSTLEQIREIERRLEQIDLSSDFQIYSELTKLKLKLANTFNSLARLYYISPVARTKLQLESLNVEKMANENISTISKILKKRSE